MIESSDSFPINTRKQRSAFPPNYVHSLDSTHMMMTAMAMHNAGLTFAAVHDSFWTHACDIDRMNIILRNEFKCMSVDLSSCISILVHCKSFFLSQIFDYHF